MAGRNRSEEQGREKQDREEQDREGQDGEEQDRIARTCFVLELHKQKHHPTGGEG